MTVFINDPRNGDRLTEIRREIFSNSNYPGSALITVSNFAVPGMLIEIQGVAVIGDRCSNPDPCTPQWPAR
jgi:enamine deaminase RidA (YjgF/YER057c/UK114 family)